MSLKSVKFHIENNDYFGTVATTLSIVRQNIDNVNCQKEDIKALNNIEKDLLYLQKKFTIQKNTYD